MASAASSSMDSFYDQIFSSSPTSFISFPCFHRNCPADKPPLQERVQLCANCHFATYCSSECQNADAKRHQAECAERVKEHVIRTLGEYQVSCDASNKRFLNEAERHLNMINKARTITERVKSIEGNILCLLESVKELKNQMEILQSLRPKIHFLLTFSETKEWACGRLLDLSNEANEYNLELKETHETIAKLDDQRRFLSHLSATTRSMR